MTDSFMTTLARASRRLLACVAAATALAASAPAFSQAFFDFEKYTLEIDPSTVFGGISGAFSSGTTEGFNWSVPSAVQVVSFGPAQLARFDLPSFTVAAKPGYALSGGSLFLGNLAFNEVGGAATGIYFKAFASVDSGPAAEVGARAMAWASTTSVPGYVAGYFADTFTANAAAFTSLSVSGGYIDLSAGGGSLGSVLAQPQNMYQVSFTAVPVPEPGAYALMFGGLAVVAWATRRRSQRRA